MFERLAKATLKINCGNSCGSGFHFINKQLVLTNHHVIENHLTIGSDVQAVTEDGTSINLELLSYSDKRLFDFAIFKVKEQIPCDRIILKPKILDYVPRGTEICFSGYPHGIDDLLVHKAVVSGPFNNLGFYIDGSVNGGNSGGPIIDITDELIIGVVTQRRFLGSVKLQEISEKAKQLQSHCNAIAGIGNVHIMGVNFTEVMSLMSESFLISNLIIETNANTGIGIGYHIKFVVEECKKLGYC